MLSSRSLKTYHYFRSTYVPSDRGYIYRNFIPDEKFFFWFEKSKLTSHLIHILQKANQLLISHMQHLLQWGVWAGGHTWKMTHPQAMEFFGVQKYFLLRVQYNIIEFQNHKRSGHPNEIPFTVVIKMINKSFDGEKGEGRVSVSTPAYFQNRNKSQKKMPM